MALTGFSPLTSSSRLLYTWTVPGDGTRIRLRHGSAGFLLIHFASRFDRNIEDLRENYNDGALDDWGHAFRATRGYATLSRHAYGLAEDLNATDHPLSAEHTFTPAELARLRKMLEAYDGCIRHGAFYSGRKDPMHAEIDRPLAEVERKARELADTKRGRAILAANPGQRAVIFS